MKKIISILAILMLLLPTTALAAKSNPTFIADVSPAVFGAQATATVQIGNLMLRSDQSLYAFNECFINGSVVLQQYVYVPKESNTTQFVIFDLGPTPSWTSGSAECVAEVRILNSNGLSKTGTIRNSQFSYTVN